MKTSRSLKLSQLPVLLALLLCFNVPSETHAAPKHSGISGQTLIHNPFIYNLIDGTSGVPYPYSGALLRVYSARNGKFITEVRTDSTGSFKINLPPGDYTVVPEALHHSGEVTTGNSIVEPSPVTVKVRSDHFTPVVLIYEATFI